MSIKRPILNGFEGTQPATASTPSPPLPHAGTHEAGGSDELDVVDLSGLLADPQFSLQSAVYREGEPSPTGNVYATYADAYAQVETMPGMRFIVVDDELGTPVIDGTGAPSYDWTGIVHISSQSIGKLLGQAWTTPLVVGEGVSIASELIQLEGIGLVNDSTVSPINTDSSDVTIYMRRIGILAAQPGKAPLFDITVNAGLVFGFAACTIKDYGAPAITAASGKLCYLNLYGGRGELDPDTLAGAGDYIVNANNPSGTISLSHSAVTGTVNREFTGAGDGAYAIGVDDTALPYTADTVQEALAAQGSAAPLVHGLGGAEHNSATLAELNAKISDDDTIGTSEKAAANGVATLDAAGRVPSSQLPLSSLEYKGTWDASTNTPTLSDASGQSGDVWIVSAAGTQDLGSGSIAFEIGDWLIHNATAYQKIDASDAVQSVNGQTGVVNLTAANVGAEPAFAKGTAFNKDFGSVSGEVCEGDDSRLSDARAPTAHGLGGAAHSADTLANLNAKISDATLLDDGDIVQIAGTQTITGAKTFNGSTFIVGSADNLIRAIGIGGAFPRVGIGGNPTGRFTIVGGNDEPQLVVKANVASQGNQLVSFVDTASENAGGFTATPTGVQLVAASSASNTRDIGFQTLAGGGTAGNFKYRHTGGGVRFEIKDSSTGGLNYICDPTAVARFGGHVRIVGDLDHNGSGVGFYATAPAAQQNITGSRGGNAALADLLTKLALTGLITDGTTA